MKMDVLSDLYEACEKVYGTPKKKEKSKLAAKISWFLFWALLFSYFAFHYWILKYLSAL